MAEQLVQGPYKYDPNFGHISREQLREVMKLILANSDLDAETLIENYCSRRELSIKRMLTMVSHVWPQHTNGGLVH